MTPNFASHLLWLLTIGSPEAQELAVANIPQMVRSSLQQMNPTIKTIKWSLEAGNYEAVYKLGAVEYITVLEPNGALVHTANDSAV